MGRPQASARTGPGSKRRPKGYLLPVDQISPLYGKSWREIGLDAFANHHSQGITGFLNSPFCAAPSRFGRRMAVNSIPPCSHSRSPAG